jgi:hypothetical protein
MCYECVNERVCESVSMVCVWNDIERERVRQRQIPSDLLYSDLPSSYVFFSFVQDSRHRRGMGGQLSEERALQTSNLPFQALIEGRQRWTDVWQELKGFNASVAVVLGMLLFRRRLRL